VLCTTCKPLPTIAASRRPPECPARAFPESSSVTSAAASALHNTMTGHRLWRREDLVGEDAAAAQIDAVWSTMQSSSVLVQQPEGTAAYKVAPAPENCRWGWSTSSQIGGSPHHDDGFGRPCRSRSSAATLVRTDSVHLLATVTGTYCLGCAGAPSATKLKSLQLSDLVFSTLVPFVAVSMKLNVMIHESQLFFVLRFIF
jgi:hypothetical protein